jgi:hypothetical protein
VGQNLYSLALRHSSGSRSGSFSLLSLPSQWLVIIRVYKANCIKHPVQSCLPLTPKSCGQGIIFGIGICPKQLVAGSFNAFQLVIVCVGTLKLEYPLLLYKDAVPMQLSLSRVVKVLCVGPSHDSPQPRATTLGSRQRLTPPHGRVWSCHVSTESDIPQGLNSESGPPWESAGPLDIQFGPPRLV